MSVAAERSHSPTHFGHKRSFEPADSPEHHAHSSDHHTKRPRRHHRVSLSREGHPGAQHASAVRASTLLALKGLFPGMEEQVREPFEGCVIILRNSDIDNAFTRLSRALHEHLAAVYLLLEAS